MKELDSLVSRDNSSAQEIIELWEFLSTYDVNDLILEEIVFDYFDWGADLFDHVVDLFEQSRFIEICDVKCCPDCSAILDTEKKAKYFCDLCTSFIPLGEAGDYRGIKVLKKTESRLPWYENISAQRKLTEFQRDVIEGFPSFIHAVQTHPPVYLANIRKNGGAVLEHDFRDDVLRATSMKWAVAAEAQSHHGRTDLFIWPKFSKTGGVIGEFKVWGRKHQDTISQLLGYFTDFEDCGFVFMINESKADISDKYRKMITEDVSYVDKSLEENPLNKKASLRHFLSTHKRPDDNEVTVYHFIFNIY